MHTKLVQFTLLVSVNHRQREFNFRQRSADLFNVDTSDERGERHYFDVISKDGHWAFNDKPIPAWLRSSEPALIQALQEQQANS